MITTILYSCRDYLIHEEPENAWNVRYSGMSRVDHMVPGQRYYYIEPGKLSITRSNNTHVLQHRQRVRFVTESLVVPDAISTAVEQLRDETELRMVALLREPYSVEGGFVVATETIEAAASGYAWDELQSGYTALVGGCEIEFLLLP